MNPGTLLLHAGTVPHAHFEGVAAVLATLFLVGLALNLALAVRS